MHSSCALEYGNVVLTREGGGLSTHHLDFPLWRQAVWLRKELRQHSENTPVHSVSPRFHSFWEGISMAAREDKFEQKSMQVKNRISWRLVIYLPHLFRC